LKSFAIEKKLIKPMFTSIYDVMGKYIGESALSCFFNDWHVWRKYETEKQRDEALQAVSNRDLWEYRKKDLKDK